MKEGASLKEGRHIKRSKPNLEGRLAYGPTQNPKKTSKGASWSKP